MQYELPATLIRMMDEVDPTCALKNAAIERSRWIGKCIGPSPSSARGSYVAHPQVQHIDQRIHPHLYYFHTAKDNTLNEFLGMAKGRISLAEFLTDPRFYIGKLTYDLFEYATQFSDKTQEVPLINQNQKVVCIDDFLKNSKIKSKILQKVYDAGGSMYAFVGPLVKKWEDNLSDPVINNGRLVISRSIPDVTFWAVQCGRRPFLSDGELLLRKRAAYGFDFDEVMQIREKTDTKDNESVIYLSINHGEDPLVVLHEFADFHNALALSGPFALLDGPKQETTLAQVIDSLTVHPQFPVSCAAEMISKAPDIAAFLNKNSGYDWRGIRETKDAEKLLFLGDGLIADMDVFNVTGIHLLQDLLYVAFRKDRKVTQ